VGDISPQNIEYVKQEHPQWQTFTGDAYAMLERVASVADLAFLTEILEHVEEPVELLRATKAKSRVLIASSPIKAPHEHDDNPEHVWQFDAEEYEALLRRGGWKPVARVNLSFYNAAYYNFQILAAEWL
jgi:hypothetical protein